MLRWLESISCPADILRVGPEYLNIIKNKQKKQRSKINMKKDFVVDKKYLNIPVCAQKEEKLLRVFLLDEEGKEEEKFTEVMVPVDAEQ